MHPIEVLEQYWNYTSFRPLQEEIITSVIEQNDTFALLPTGGGKTICFQIPALLKEGICIVISPLIALMKDQVNALKAKGIKAMALTSGLSHTDLDTQLDNCIYGKYKFLYVSPERLQQHLIKERLQLMKVNLIVVDEAHCISQWGHDFRPAYRNIIALRQMHPHANCIALTATAKQNVIDDIIENLDFINPKVFKGTFERPNISYQVIKTEDKWFQLQFVLNQYKGTAIIYTRSRRKTIEVDAFLRQKGFLSTFYHGGISNEEKQSRLQQWMNNRVDIMVATTAFGMGIDKADVTSVIHFNLPDSLENYYQEAGRAGRNGENAYAIIITQTVDSEALKQQFLGNLPSIKFIKKVYNKLCNFFQIPYGEGELSTHQLDFKFFCKTYKLHASKTYNVLIILDRNGIISLTQQFSYRTEIQFLIPSSALFQYLEKNKVLNTIVRVLLRTYGGIMDYVTKINLSSVVNRANTSEKEVIQQLKQLEKDEVISLKLSNSDTEITFLKPREDAITINPIVKTVKKQYENRHQQIEAVLQYISNDKLCRSRQLLHYFEINSQKDSSVCDVCVSKQKHKFPYKDIQLVIIKALQESDLSSRQLLKYVPDKEVLLKVLKILLEDGKVKITPENTYKYIN